METSSFDMSSAAVKQADEEIVKIKEAIHLKEEEAMVDASKFTGIAFVSFRTEEGMINKYYQHR